MGTGNKAAGHYEFLRSWSCSRTVSIGGLRMWTSSEAVPHAVATVGAAGMTLVAMVMGWCSPAPCQQGSSRSGVGCAHSGKTLHSLWKLAPCPERKRHLHGTKKDRNNDEHSCSIITPAILVACAPAVSQ